MKRTFIAIKLPLSIIGTEPIQNIKNNLKDEKVRWVDYLNLHLTLFFLGDTEEDLIEKISEELKEELKSIKSFNLQCKGLGIFKSVHNPKALWFGFDESDELKRLKIEIDKALRKFGFAIEEKAFNPHLTLGRMKFIKNRSDLISLIEKYKDAVIQDFCINEVIFYESTLTQRGPIYSVLNKFLLS